MKKTLLSLLAIITLSIGLSSCGGSRVRTIDSYFTNDTVYTIADWGMLVWDDYVDVGYKVTDEILYHDNKDYAFRVDSGYQDGPIPVPQDEIVFPVWMYWGDNNIYAPLLDGVIYSTRADADMVFYLSSWKWYYKTAAADGEDKPILITENGDVLDVVVIGQVAEDGSYLFN